MLIQTILGELFHSPTIFKQHKERGRGFTSAFDSKRQYSSFVFQVTADYSD